MSVVYGEQQRNGAFGGAPFGATPSGVADQRALERQYHVVLQDSLGHPALGFRDGMWFRLTVSGPQGLQLRGAIRHCPHAAGSIVQITCWWMRENPLLPRSLDLATELALTVGELVRVCPADGLGSTSGDLLPMATMAMAAGAAPALPAAPVAAAAQPAFAAPSVAPAPAAAPATTGSWFDPDDTSGTGGFPAIPPAPVMGQPRAAAPAQASPLPTYQQARTPYPPAPQGYGSAAAAQAALPAAGYQAGAGAGAAAAPRAAAPRGYGEQAVNSDWDRPAAAPSPGRRAAPQQQPYIPAPVQPPRQAAPQRTVPNGNGVGHVNGSGQQPRPRPQGSRPEFRDERPEFRDERRDSFQGRAGDPDLGRSSDRLDRSGDRLDPRGSGQQPRRPAPRQQAQRGTMGQRPASRPGRQSDW